MSLISAGPTYAWVNFYDGGFSFDQANDIAVDADGNVYVTGVSNSDCATVKYNSTGSQQWVAIYNGTGNGLDEATSIAVDMNGNVYVTGYSWGGPGPEYDYVTIKYDQGIPVTKKGDVFEAWVKRYNGTGDDEDRATSIAVDTNGYVYVTGYCWGGEGAQEDYVTIQYDPDGQEQWVGTYNYLSRTLGLRDDNHGDDDIYGDFAYAIAVDGDGNSYVTGTSYDGAYRDYATLKYNFWGELQWAERYGGAYGDAPTSLAVDANQNVYVTGYIIGTAFKRDYATVKYNSAGIFQWDAIYNNAGVNGPDKANSIAVDGSGNVYVTGYSDGLSGPGYSGDYATVKYDSTGEEQWVRRFDGPENLDDVAYSLALDGQGCVYVTGECDHYGASHGDYATVKYNSLGYRQWVKIFNGPGNGRDCAKGIVVHPNNGYVYVTGYSYYGTSRYNDYATIRYGADHQAATLID
jgi:uncharacterized delta-60 repeat protein